MRFVRKACANHATKKKKVSLMLDPLKIAFSQDSISFKFSNGTPLSIVITKLTRGTLLLDTFPPIRVFYQNNTWYSLDNRRLYVFKEAAKKGVFTQIPVIDTHLSELKRREISAKLTTMNAGRHVTVRGTAARVADTKKCHYCLNKCKTAGQLFLHCQEEHLEEYREEIRASTQTIDQFLLSKDFAVKDDLIISLENLQVETHSEKQHNNCANSLTGEFTKLSFPKRLVYDMKGCKNLTREIQISKEGASWDGDDANDGRETRENMNRENMNPNSNPPLVKQVLYRAVPWKVYWQDNIYTDNEVYVVNLANKVLHFHDEQYPLS